MHSLERFGLLRGENKNGSERKREKKEIDRGQIVWFRLTFCDVRSLSQRICPGGDEDSKINMH